MAYWRQIKHSDIVVNIGYLSFISCFAEVFFN